MSNNNNNKLFIVHYFILFFLKHVGSPKTFNYFYNNNLSSCKPTNQSRLFDYYMVNKHRSLKYGIWKQNKGEIAK